MNIIHHTSPQDHYVIVAQSETDNELVVRRTSTIYALSAVIVTADGRFTIHWSPEWVDGGWVTDHPDDTQHFDVLDDALNMIADWADDHGYPMHVFAHARFGI
jgi:hypothetical protein